MKKPNNIFEHAKMNFTPFGSFEIHVHVYYRFHNASCPGITPTSPPPEFALLIKHINTFAHTENVCANNNNKIILTSAHLLTQPEKKCSPCMRSIYDFLHVMILARTL